MVVQALAVSQALLWVAVLALAVTVLALARQIGVLHERVAPAGALMGSEEPRVGEPGPALEATALDGRTLRVGGPNERRRNTLLLFVSPRCPVCKHLMPAARSLARAERRETDLVFVSDGDDVEDHRRFVRDQGLESIPYVLSARVGIAYHVGRLPYAVLLDADGIVRARGLVNTREHLESLFVARESGFASIQDYVAAGAPGAAAAPANGQSARRPSQLA